MSKCPGLPPRASNLNKLVWVIGMRIFERSLDVSYMQPVLRTSAPSLLEHLQYAFSTTSFTK